MNENILREEETLEIDLLGLLFVLLQKWWLILLAGIVGAVAMMGVTAFLMTPQYQSQSMLYMLNKSQSVTSMTDLQIGSELTEDFTVIATSNPVIDAVIEQVEKEEGVTLTRKEILGMLDIGTSSATRIVKITATSENPVRACIVANGVADETSARMVEITKSDPLTTVERAEVPEEPSSPSMMKNVVLGFVAFVMLMCVFLVVRDILNDTIKNEEHVNKYLGVPVLAIIPYVKGKEHKKEELEKLKDGAPQGARARSQKK